MNLLPDDDQQAIVDAVRQVLGAQFPRSRLLAPGGARLTAAAWQDLADLGWLGLGLDEAAGGTGLGAAEEALLFVELGRHLVPGPFLGTVLGAHLAAAAGRLDVARSIAGGGEPVGLLVPAPDPAHPHHHYLVDGADAPWALRFAGGGAALVATADLGAAEPVDGLDPAVDLQIVAVAHVPAAVELGGEVAGALADRAAVLAAAFQTGIAAAALDESCRYARERQQFGQPIGAFQAVKHRCADMAVRLESARSITLLAALSIDAGSADAPFQAAAAKLLADDAARANAAANVQNHGGIGFTWEHGAHLLVTRAEVVGELVCPTSDALHHVLMAPAPTAG